VVKNLHINFAGKYSIKKKNVHEIVNYLKNELNFKITAMSVNFVDSAEISKMNIKYLNHHRSTDIITFNYSGKNDELDGELFISVEDARNNARAYGVKLKEELVRLIIHGFLHLLCFNDKISSERKKMIVLQENLLNNCKFVL
jgi:rRNA maturation RNase YbeY